MSASSLNRSIAFVIAFVLVAVTLWFGSRFPADSWYQDLTRAPWNPPNWAFPVAWSFLYLLIGIAGGLILSQQDRLLKTLWLLQLAVNALWSYLFFGLHMPMASLIDLLVLDALVLALIILLVKRKHKLPALLLAPYLAWICLATSLNIYIVAYN